MRPVYVHAPAGSLAADPAWLFGDKLPGGGRGAVWNVTRGCSRVSSGCDNCYAMGQAHRFSGAGKPYEGLTTIRRGKVGWVGKARLVPEMLAQPLKWKKPRRIFANSMSDLFHESLSFEDIAAVFGVMAACPQHTFQVLTKRPKRALEFFEWAQTLKPGAVEASAYLMHLFAPTDATANAQVRVTREKPPWPLQNVHLGVSVEDQKTADERIYLLLQCPAAVRFVSAEPLLGPVDFRYLQPGDPPTEINALDGTHGVIRPHRGECDSLDWVIVGGESGHGARPCNVEWIRSIVGQCAEAKVPCFVKQLGPKPYEQVPHLIGGYGNGPLDLSAKPVPPGWTLVRTQDEAFLMKYHRFINKKGAEPSEWPADLRVQQFPGGASC